MAEKWKGIWAASLWKMGQFVWGVDTLHWREGMLSSTPWEVYKFYKAVCISGGKLLEPIKLVLVPQVYARRKKGFIVPAFGVSILQIAPPPPGFQPKALAYNPVPLK